MKRRSFFAALAGLPFVGKLLASDVDTKEPPYCGFCELHGMFDDSGELIYISCLPAEGFVLENDGYVIVNQGAGG
jgi:hypothetical protein